MSDLVLRPRSATELVDAAFQVYRRAPVQFMVAVAAVYVPWLVIRLVFDLNITPGSPAAIAAIDFNQIVLMAVVAVVIFVLAGGVTTMIARDVYLDRPPDVVTAFGHVFRRFVPLVVVTLIVVVFGVIGLMLFAFPAFYVLARFFAVRQVVLLEDAGVGRAMRRTSELSVGTKWHILATLFFVAVLTFAIDIGVSLLIGRIPSQVFVNLVSTAVAVVIGPLFGIAETVLYYDLRIRKEGFDVEYMAGATTPTPARPSDLTV